MLDWRPPLEARGRRPRLSVGQKMAVANAEMLQALKERGPASPAGVPPGTPRRRGARYPPPHTFAHAHLPPPNTHNSRPGSERGDITLVVISQSTLVG